MSLFSDKLNVNLTEFREAVIEDRDKIHDILSDLNDGSFPVYAVEKFGIFMMKIDKNGSTIVNVHGQDYFLYDFLDEIEKTKFRDDFSEWTN